MIQPNDPTIGVLYCGDLGTALCKGLVARGVRTITTVEGRSNATKTRAQHSSAEIVESLERLVDEAEIILSLVLPGAAEQVASECASYAINSRISSKKIFVDVNSLELSRLDQVRERAVWGGFDFVDGSIHGSAKNLQKSAVFYLSGERAIVVAECVGRVTATRVLGTEPTLATRMKLLLAGQAKTAFLVMVEIAMLAHRAGLLDEFLHESKRFYPENFEVLERMFPTYASHAARRIIELQGVGEFSESVGSSNLLVTAARDFLLKHVESFSLLLDSVESRAEIYQLISEFSLHTKNKELSAQDIDQ